MGRFNGGPWKARRPIGSVAWAPTRALQAGDPIEVCAFALKDFFAERPEFSRRFIHGHMLVMPGGQMRAWGPYGKLDNCIRPSDQAAAWVEFLDRDSLARAAWCNSRAFVQVASTASKAFVDEINSRMASGCD